MNWKLKQVHHSEQGNSSQQNNRNQLRILFLNYEYPPLGGGAGVASKNLLSEFSKRNLKVNLITSSHDNRKKTEDIFPNICGYFLPIGDKEKSLHAQSKKDLLIYLFKAFFLYRKLLREKEYDACLAFFTVPCGIIPWIFRKKIPYFICLRGSDVPGYNNAYNTIYWLFKPLFRKIWMDAKLVFSVSSDLADLSHAILPDLKIEIIPNGIDKNFFRPKAIDTEANDIFRILTVSRFRKRKALNFLIEATGKLIHTYKDKNIELVIIGEGELENDLKRLAAEQNITQKTHFVGIIPNQELVKYYHEASCFVLPSIFEGMSNALLEAKSCGLPVIVTDTGGASDIVEENDIIVRKKSSDDIFKALKTMLHRPFYKKTPSKKILSWSEVAEKYYDFIELATCNSNSQESL